MIQRFRIGNNLSVIWLLYEDDGNIHNLEGKNIELYMACGGYKYPVTDYTVTENAVAWVFPAAMQTKTGYYKLVLIERDPVRGLYSYDVSEAFCLEPKDALTNIETIVDEDATVQIKSVLTYAHITNLASVDTVETEGGTVAEIHLTNGKTFNIPLGGGGSGSGGGGSYTLLPATATRLGGIRVGFTKDGAKYPVRLDGLNNAYVEVPDSGSITVLNSLYSHSEGDALSANMGRALREMIESLPSGGGDGGGEGVLGRSRYVLYLRYGGPEFFRRPGTNISLWKFRTGSEYWDIYPRTGDIAMCFNGSGTIGCFEVAVSENEGDEEEIVIYNNSTMRQFHLNVADLEGGGGGGGDVEPGEPGRSITGVDYWFKLTADESVQATPMSVADPSSSA